MWLVLLRSMHPLSLNALPVILPVLLVMEALLQIASLARILFI